MTELVPECAQQREQGTVARQGEQHLRGHGRLGGGVVREPEVVQDGSTGWRGRGWAVPRQDRGREAGLLRGPTSIQ